MSLGELTPAELCNRCLIVPDAQVEYVARWDDQTRGLPTGNPKKTAQFVEQVMTESGGDAVFMIGSLYNVLIPVSTWHGDRVCMAHLWELRDAELRGYGQRR